MTDSRKKALAEKRGRRAEQLAVLTLFLKGYRVLEQRFKCAAGEIDIIAQKRGRLFFIEVKARQSLDAALSSLSQKQRRRIEKAALFYCQQRGLMGMASQFDVILLEPNRLPRHIPNAWFATLA